MVMLGGAIGAGARQLANRAALALAGPGWPWATLSVNLIGGFAMGLLAAMLARGLVGEPARLFLGVGVLGGFTTFSAFSLELVGMAESGAFAAALGYALLSVIGAALALAAGLTLGRALA
jgi:CrcB protein